SLTAGMDYDVAKLDSDTSATANDKGRTLPQVPRFTANGTANYVFPIAGAIEGRLGATVQYVGHRFEDIGNTLPYQAYTLINLQAAVLAPNNWEVMVYADNVTNRVVFYELSGEVLGNYVNQPRTIGVRVSKNF
ncbi:MAG: TonB-dependent receptor domain-containing protein, partial [Terriglobia bacterium]